MTSASTRAFLLARDIWCRLMVRAVSLILKLQWDTFQRFWLVQTYREINASHGLVWSPGIISRAISVAISYQVCEKCVSYILCHVYDLFLEYLIQYTCYVMVCQDKTQYFVSLLCVYGLGNIFSTIKYCAEVSIQDTVTDDGRNIMPIAYANLRFGKLKSTITFQWSINKIQHAMIPSIVSNINNYHKNYTRNYRICSSCVQVVYWSRAFIWSCDPSNDRLRLAATGCEQSCERS
jgi:hypothetical protein